MDLIRKHQRILRFIVIIASLALVASSLLPLFYGGLG